MIGWTIQIAVLSFIFIYLVHHLLNFFKNMLTVPKMKDLVDSPNKKYENIFATLNNTNKSHSFSNTSGFTDIDLLPSFVNDSNGVSDSNSVSNGMKDELKSFLKKQLNSDSNSNSNNNNLDIFQPSGSSSMFSNF
jgi:hypothetical protein